jgi:ATP-dependent protease ClpP protease subunit
MRATSKGLCILATALVAIQALAGPFEDGIKAYDAGDFATALNLWRPLAEEGRAQAQFNLGVLYEKGQGVSQDLAESASWYLRAARKGDLDAQFKVAGLYENGIGVPRDPDEARQWYRVVLMNPLTDRETQQTKQRAMERLKSLPLAPGEMEEAFAYSGGRFLLHRASSGDCVVAMQGSVTRDSTSSFRDAATKADAVNCRKPWILLLESPGGLVDQAIDLGALVRAQKLRTVARYGCASACSLIFLAGAERVLWGSRAAIGFHQPSSASDRRCDEYGISLGMYRIKEYLRDTAPSNADRLIELVAGTSCKSIDWIRGKRALDLGIATSIEAENADVFGPISARRLSK